MVGLTGTPLRRLVVHGGAVALLGLLGLVGLVGCGGDDSGDGADGGASVGIGAAGDPNGLLGFFTGTGTGDGFIGTGPDSNVCKHVDLIIAVDGSSSMTEELQAIRDEVFPAFADRLLEISGGIEDFRVATLDACPYPASFHTRGQIGECNFQGGNVWIESYSQNLRAEFACVGGLFQDDTECSGNNDDEQPSSAAAAALEREFGGGVNAGFSRPDALLVVVAITDEDEQPTDTATDAQTVHDRIVAAKGGDANRVVFLGIGGSRQCFQGAYGGAQEATVLRGISTAFGGRGFFWDLCEGRLEEGLDQVFDIIDRACGELPPPPAFPPELSTGPE